MKKAALAVLLTSVLLFTSVAAEALVCDLADREIVLCDNFGKIWYLMLDKGEIRGYRQTDKCGQLPVFGTVCCPQNKIRLTVLDGPTDVCDATFWEGRFTSHALDTVEGLVYNERGDIDEFVLYVCDDEPTVISGDDPAE